MTKQMCFFFLKDIFPRDNLWKIYTILKPKFNLWVDIKSVTKKKEYQYQQVWVNICKQLKWKASICEDEKNWKYSRHMMSQGLQEESTLGDYTREEVKV